MVATFHLPGYTPGADNKQLMAVDHELLQGAVETSVELASHDFPERDEELLEPYVVAVAEGFRPARTIPLVGYAVGTALDALAHPDLNRHIPSEMGDRLSLAMTATSLVVESSTARGLFEEYDHQFNGLLAEQGLAGDDETDPSAVETLATAPFRDVAWVGGGALGFLKERGYVGDATELIAYSEGLKAVSRLSQHHADESRRALGFPYIDPTFFEDRGHELGYTSSAQEIIDRLSGQGCPARALFDEELPPVFDQSWIKLVNYSVPPQATIEI